MNFIFGFINAIFGSPWLLVFAVGVSFIAIEYDYKKYDWKYAGHPFKRRAGFVVIGIFLIVALFGIFGGVRAHGLEQGSDQKVDLPK